MLKQDNFQAQSVFTEDKEHIHVCGRIDKNWWGVIEKDSYENTKENLQTLKNQMFEDVYGDILHELEDAPYLPDRLTNLLLDLKEMKENIGKEYI